MKTKLPTTIDEVLDVLANIIQETEENNDTLGYFAAVYRKVTVKVKQEIANNYFDDGERMEKLDVVFANRYIDAYYDFKENKTITQSWLEAFQISTDYWPIVLQHLLLGMNAHINLDLGIAAAHISKNKNINDLEGDFNKINEILSSLVDEIQNDLSEIWPKLKWILTKVDGVDDFLVDFSMKIARDGAWKFAKSIANLPMGELVAKIDLRDKKVSKKVTLIIRPELLAKIIFGIIRISERGSVAVKIKNLKP